MSENPGYKASEAAMRAKREQLAKDGRERYAANPKYCPTCGTLIPYESRWSLTFCNRSCAATYNNAQKAKHRIPVLPLCACGNTVGHRNNKFCAACIQMSRGHHICESSETAKKDSTRRRYLLRTRPHQCQYPGCGITEWLGAPVPLEMDHVDGDSDNNTEENLRLICPNCHALTPTHRGKNRNRGKISSRQASRNQRYADGLTY